MITGKDIYEILSAVVPLYVAVILAYGSVRWWKIFTPEQCSGINRFVSVFAVPFLSFQFIAFNDPYTMNFRFIAGDSLQKGVILVTLFLLNTFTKWVTIDWTITFFSLSTLPNTLLMGLPLLKAMYGDFTGPLMVQIVMLQCVIWYTILLFLFEYRAAMTLISQQFPQTAGVIASLRVDSDVTSLNGRDPLQTEVEIEENGKLHVVVRSMSRISNSFHMSHSSSIASNLSGVEIYSVPSFRENATKNFHLINVGGFEEDTPNMKRSQRSKSYSGGMVSSNSYHPSMKPLFFSGSYDDGGVNNSKDLHMFVWNSSNASSPVVSDVSLKHGMNKSIHASAPDFKVLENPHQTKGVHEVIDMNRSLNASRKSEGIGSINKEDDGNRTRQQMPPLGLIVRLILTMVWRNLIRNPNTHASVLGLVWSLLSFRWNFKMPSIIEGSISIMSKTGLGMAMFSLGNFMALQPKIITCGKRMAAISMAIRFLVGPAVIAATAKAVGIHGVFYRVAIVQATLPQAIVPFVFAKEYNLHADILSTGVIFGMVVSLPVSIIYYLLLGL